MDGERDADAALLPQREGHHAAQRDRAADDRGGAVLPVFADSKVEDEGVVLSWGLGIGAGVLDQEAVAAGF